jgi:hypothetical protein
MGILETETHMKRRIRMIAKFRRANNWSVLATSVAATLALVTLTDAQSGKPAASASQPHEDTQAKPEGPPRIVSTSPKVGEVEVSPGLTEITVTFDQDMEKGCSWTGGGPEFPPGQDGKKAVWRNPRTCVLPVKLQAAQVAGTYLPAIRFWFSLMGRLTSSRETRNFECWKALCLFTNTNCVREIARLVGVNSPFSGRYRPSL